MPKILHLDLDAFFCAVEEQRDPSLHGKPFAVGGRPEQRGVVSSCSYPARQLGVRSAMPMARALRLCPTLIIIPPNHHAYHQASEQVMAALHQLTPLVEQISINEAFLDLSDLPDPSETLARRLQESIRQQLGLPCSLGVASNKLVAKIATDVGKAANRSGEPPCAVTVVPPGEEAAFLSPLPVQALWGVGPKTAQRLEELGIRTIGQLAAWPEADLARRFGKNGAEMSSRAHGIDSSPIVTSHETKSISQEVTFSQDLRDAASLRRTLRQLSERVGLQTRQSNLCGRTVKIKLRWADFTTLTRQSTLGAPTDQDEQIYAAALHLFEAAWSPSRPVRLLGVGLSNFTAPARQLSLWESASPEQQRLQHAIDELRQRYGKQVLRRGDPHPPKG
ncbi:MAG: DNA polymerase IV [Anaerolineales bacterium]|nr:DNA polymerase IV [Anaerolineales bacterium]